MQHRQAEMGQLAIELKLQFDALETNHRLVDNQDQLFTDLYSTIGSLRGLIDAMTNTQAVINHINWEQWASPRFQVAHLY